MASGDRKLGDIATQLILENDKVRIWNLVVAPGESSDWHLHENDYVTVVVEGGNLDVEYDDGSVERSPSELGSWRYHGDHRIHRVTNKTNSTYRNVLIELK